MSLAIIQHSISAGGNFNGTDPGTTPVIDKDIKRYPAAAAGGLFDFQVDQPHDVVAIELHLANQTSWSIVKEDSDGDDIELAAGTTDSEYVLRSSDRFVLTEGEKLKVTTAGATTAMKCRVALRRLG